MLSFEETENTEGVDLSSKERKLALTQRAEALGFAHLGVAPIPLELRTRYYEAWIATGQHGTMDWMERNNERRLEPKKLLPEAKSILVFGLNYYQPDPENRRFRISKYALGDDYHNLILKRLQKICRYMREHFSSNQRPYVDTGPLLEKPIAAAAGLGWQGKSTILLNNKSGTWLFLGNIVTDLELPPDAPSKDRCGTCTKCIEACPTRAITAPYKLDARRCIAYLTNEHDGPIPLEFRRAIGDRLFGCEECLDVCPWNRWAQQTREARFAPRELPELRELLRFDEARFRETFQGSPLKRLKLPRFLRNACTVMGNVGNEADIPALQVLAESENAMVAEHATWAINEIRTRSEAG